MYVDLLFWKYWTLILSCLNSIRFCVFWGGRCTVGIESVGLLVEGRRKERNQEEEEYLGGTGYICYLLN